MFGYIAAGLVLATFTMRTMIPPRLLGIASSIYRMVEMRRLIGDLETAEGDSEIEAPMPYMTAEARPRGSVLFRG